MESSIILRSVDELKFLGLIKSDRDYARMLNKSANWVRSLRRKDVQVSRRVHQTTAMRLQRCLTVLKERASPSVAERLESLIDEVSEADYREQYAARRVVPS